MNSRSQPADAALTESAGEFGRLLRNAVAMEKARPVFESRQLYLAAVAAKPGDAAALEGAARMAAATGDRTGALVHLRAAVAANPERDGSRERLIAALLHSGELAEAEKEARALLARKP